MQCKNCQTEIDDKALICFRCGVATVEPVRRQVEVAPRRARKTKPFLLAAVFFAVVGVFLTRASEAQSTSPTVWLILGVAGVLLVYRLRFW